MKLIILILLLTTNKVLGQNKSNQYERLEVKNQYNIIETLINNEHTENEKENNIESYSIIYNSKKDSVVYYGLSNSFPILYVLKNEKKTKKLKLYIMENKKKVDSISIVFSDQKKAIEVNKDLYFFNSTYYKSLKNNVLQLKNIADIIDLLDDMLGDYPYQIDYLKDFSSKNKYNSKDNKILKARIITFRTQANDF
ncbi:hypothetical protein, partial [Flavobacterium sp. C3NV]|uniref:hypothetical protein n=1 Tax=Flavobacterium sp. C3NV TaxID=3393358 RepID=UPI00398FCA66